MTNPQPSPLSEWLRHKPECHKWGGNGMFATARLYNGHDCTCGLDAALAQQPSSCVCMVDDGLVQEWVSKARAVAKSKGYVIGSQQPSSPLTELIAQLRDHCFGAGRETPCGEPCYDDDGYCLSCKWNADCHEAMVAFNQLEAALVQSSPLKHQEKS